jgi:hypothetical protein
MRSVYPALLRWSLRPSPTGLRRFAAGYLAAAAGALVALVVLGVAILASRDCLPGGGASGFGCQSSNLRSLGLAVLGGVAATLAFSMVTKLGLRYFSSLLAAGVSVLVVAGLLQIAGLDVMPYAVVIMAGAPALAAWITNRGAVPDSALPTRRNRR